MLSSTPRVILLALFCPLVACSIRHIPQPMLERSDRSQSIDEAVVAQDVRTCRTEVRDAAPTTIQPRWLPPLGGAADSVVLGTVDVAHPVWPSREAYRQALERCLTARGYDTLGWK